jgi:hypothetical protein
MSALVHTRKLREEAVARVQGGESYRAVGRALGVSDNSVRRWCAVARTENGLQAVTLTHSDAAKLGWLERREAQAEGWMQLAESLREAAEQVLAELVRAEGPAVPWKPQDLKSLVTSAAIALDKTLLLVNTAVPVVQEEPEPPSPASQALHIAMDIMHEMPPHVGDPVLDRILHELEVYVFGEEWAPDRGICDSEDCLDDL